MQNFVYTYDAIGNVSARADLINSVSEAFGYDALDRLTAATVTNGTGPHPVTTQYDDAAGNLGNLTHKSDISTLPSASMTYSGTGRPHALQTLNTGSATRTFTYNANGSMTGGQVDSATRTLAWTSYELAASVTIGTTSRTFSYGADRQRYRQVSVSGGTTRTYTYAGEHYVKEVEGASTEHKLYIYANGEQLGYVSDDGTPETRYFHKDHLGSITTIITNQNWAGREKLSYDAWGKRRSGTDWWSAAATASEERGYTGHEHLDNVTLIHMNGRLLDPKLGRAISADPFVPAPLFSQSYNRYAYVYNNPLKYTDPSGFGPCDGIFKAPWCGFPRPRDGGGGGGGGGGGFGGSDWTPPPDMSAYYEALLAHWAQQDAEAAQHAAAQFANSWRVDHPAGKTDQEGLKPLSAFEKKFVEMLPQGQQPRCDDGCHHPPIPVQPLDPRLVVAGSYVVAAVGAALVAFDIANTVTLVTAGPDTSLVGVPMMAGAQAARVAARAPAASTAAERVTELAEQGLTQIQRERFVTLAVTETKEGVRVISSSTPTVQSSVTALLKEGEVAVSGVGHAELTGINGARTLGYTPTGVAASRPICTVCGPQIIAEGVEPLTRLK